MILIFLIINLINKGKIILKVEGIILIRVVLYSNKPLKKASNNKYNKISFS